MRGLLQGADGGAAYEEYRRSFRRDVELEEKARKVNEEIKVHEQLITLFMITTTTMATPNPSHVTCLGQLQSAISDKRKELQDMVTAILPDIQ